MKTNLDLLNKKITVANFTQLGNSGLCCRAMVNSHRFDAFENSFVSKKEMSVL